MVQRFQKAYRSSTSHDHRQSSLLCFIRSTIADSQIYGIIGLNVAVFLLWQYAISSWVSSIVLRKSS